MFNYVAQESSLLYGHFFGLDHAQDTENSCLLLLEWLANRNVSVIYVIHA